MWFEVETVPVYDGQKVREVTIRTQCIALFYIDPVTSYLMVQDNNEEHFKVISIPSINPTNNTPILGPSREQFKQFIERADYLDKFNNYPFNKSHSLAMLHEESQISPKSPTEMLKNITFEE